MAIPLNQNMEEMDMMEQYNIDDDDNIGGFHKIKVDVLVVEALSKNDRHLSILPQGDLVSVSCL